MKLVNLIVLITLILSNSKIFAQEEPKQETDGAKSLMKAARDGDIETVKQLIADGIDVNSKTDYGATALSYAAERGHMNVVKHLIENGADPNVMDSFYKASPYTWALLSGHNDVAKFIKENGGKPSFDMGSGISSKKNSEVPVTVEFKPSSTESKMADRNVSSVNWPQFRGTGARGVADRQSPPVRWDVPANENVLWKTSVPGLGHSCPVVWQDRVFLTTAISGKEPGDIKIGNYGDVDSVEDDSVHKFQVLCLNKANGNIVWTQTANEAVPKVKRHLKSTHANPTVATDGQNVVAFFGSEGLYCYDIDGNLLWEQQLGFLDSGWFYDDDYQWGFAASPVIHQNKVIVQCDIQKDSFIAAFDLGSGSEIWRTERDEIPGWSTPTIHQHDGRAIIITNGTRGIRGYDASNGQEIWKLTGNSEIVAPTPFVAHDLMYITSGYRPIKPIYAISAEARGDLTLADGETANEFVRWSIKKNGPYMATPIVYGDYLYSLENSGVLTCYQATTGLQAYRLRVKLDKEKFPNAATSSNSFVASPIAGDGHLYFPAENGNVFVVKAGPEYELVSVNPIGENVLSSPAISEGIMFVRGQHHLIAVSSLEQ